MIPNVKNETLLKSKKEIKTAKETLPSNKNNNSLFLHDFLPPKPITDILAWSFANKKLSTSQCLILGY
jgi:hypothetical protein